MPKAIKDEIIEHREGQSLFTKRRIIFASILFATAVGIGAWFVMGRS